MHYYKGITQGAAILATCVSPMVFAATRMSMT
jgi:hypothetical protein